MMKKFLAGIFFIGIVGIDGGEEAQQPKRFIELEHKIGAGGWTTN